MECVYPHLRGQGQPELERLGRAAERLSRKLSRVELSGLGLSPYFERYLTERLRKLSGVMQLYTYLLHFALRKQDGPWDGVALVDYGGGIGLISLLAVEAGVGRVIYNDIYDVSCDDVATLSTACGIDIDEIVCGDIDALNDHVRDNGGIDALVSFDVIEHVYDIAGYLRQLKTLGGAGMRLVMASSANTDNPVIAWRTRKIHREVETQNREPEWGAKERDLLASYRDARAAIIREHAPGLREPQVVELATRTRGLRVEAIQAVVDEYETTGTICYEPDDPTNTCDPHTGNWAEHLMDPGGLTDILAQEGFSCAVQPGFWNDAGSKAARVVKRLLNQAIRVTPKGALRVAPAYVIVARRDADRPPRPPPRA